MLKDKKDKIQKDKLIQEQASSSSAIDLFHQNDINSSIDILLKKIVVVGIVIIVLSIVIMLIYIKLLNQKHQDQLFKYKLGIKVSNKQRQYIKVKMQSKVTQCQNKIVQLKQKKEKQLENFRQINNEKYISEYKRYEQKLQKKNIQFINSVKQININLRQYLLNSKNFSLDQLNNKDETCLKSIAKFQQDSLINQNFLKNQRPIIPPMSLFSAPKKLYLQKQQQLLKLSYKKDFIIVTPAGRRQYLQILYLHLLKQKQMFFQWHLWLNTEIDQDLSYMNKLSKQNNWIKIIKLDDIKNETNKKHIQTETRNKLNHFYKKDLQKNKVYLKLDDDTVWIDDNFIKKMWDHRLKLASRIIIHPNIINNPMITHIHQRAHAFQYSQPVLYDTLCNGWYNPNVSFSLHKQFIQSIQTKNISKWKTFKQWQINGFQLFSINGFLYFSQTIDSMFFTDQYRNQMLYSTIYPLFYGKPSLIVGDAIMVHAAFSIQRNYLKVVFPQMIETYKAIAQAK